MKANERKTPKAYDELTKEEFDQAMSIGLAQAKAGKADPVDEVFDRLLRELEEMH